MFQTKTLIVDDEKPAVELLLAYAAKIPELTVIGTAHSAIAAKAILQEKPVDLLFLDIQMPDLTGLQLLRMLKNPPAVVLTTAYSEFALEGYELDVLDYLLKPIEFGRFYKAVSKLVGSRPQRGEQLAQEIKEDYFFVKTDHQIIKVNFADILFIESLREYVRIHTTTQRIVARLAMQRLEEELPSAKFIRIHRTYIVNIDAVQKIEGNVLHIGKEQLPVSKGKREEFMAFIEGKVIG
ncbi:MAG: response regulator transcription factor [Saprospiraceae bacterium]|nr:response regulator transcription factor [Saprospiraceae bacterium]